MENDNTQVEAGTTNPSEDRVAIPEASDDDLDAFLAKADEEGAQLTDETPETEEDGEKSEVEASSEEKPKTEEHPEDAIEKAREADVKRLKEQNEALKLKLEQQERYIQRRANEIGDLRKQLKSERDTRAERIDDLFAESPREAMAEQRRIEKIDEKLEALDQEETGMTERHYAEKVFSKHLNPAEVTVDMMAESLQQDGLDAEFVQAFRQDPYRVTSPDTLVQLGKRARAEGAIRKLIPLMKGLIQENEKLKARPGQVLKNVDNALRQPQKMTGRSGGSAPSRGKGVSVSQMSDAELDAFLKESK